MRDHLLGYLLGALEPEERNSVEQCLAGQPELRHDLEALDRALCVLKADKGHCDPPLGLAERTCEFVVIKATAIRTAARPAGTPSRWTIADFVVAAGIFLAASMLIFPALGQSRRAARLAQCQNNLRDMGVALAGYSRANGGYFPRIPSEGNQAIAGIYAPTLVDSGYVTDPTKVVCPNSKLASMSRFRVPSRRQLDEARGETLASLQRSAGGSYAYVLGHMANGAYRSTKNLNRPRFAVMADMPEPSAKNHFSSNHGGTGQNVLFEDGHVEHLASCSAEDGGDDFFVNDAGQVAAGLHPDDSVLAPSAARPIIMPVNWGR